MASRREDVEQHAAQTLEYDWCGCSWALGIDLVAMNQLMLPAALASAAEPPAADAALLCTLIPTCCWLVRCARSCNWQ